MSQVNTSGHECLHVAQSHEREILVCRPRGPLCVLAHAAETPKGGMCGFCYHKLIATYTVQSQHHSLTLLHVTVTFTDTFMYYIDIYIDSKWHFDCIKLCHKSLLLHINNKDIHVVLGQHGNLAKSSTVTFRTLLLQDSKPKPLEKVSVRKVQ